MMLNIKKKRYILIPRTYEEPNLKIEKYSIDKFS